MRKLYESIPFCPLDTSSKPRNWRTFYGHSPVNSNTGGGRYGTHDKTSEYREWLMTSRHLDLVAANEIIKAQLAAPSGIISASFHPDDMATRPAPKTPRKPAKAVAAPALTVPAEYRDIVAALIAGNAAGALAQLQGMLAPCGAMTPSALRRALTSIAA